MDFRSRGIFLVYAFMSRVYTVDVREKNIYFSASIDFRPWHLTIGPRKIKKKMQERDPS